MPKKDKKIMKMSIYMSFFLYEGINVQKVYALSIKRIMPLAPANRFGRWGPFQKSMPLADLCL